MRRATEKNLDKRRFKRLEKKLEEGKQKIHLNKHTLGAEKLLRQYGREDVFCPELNRDRTIERKVRRQKQYERMVAKDAEEIRQENLRYSELGKFMSSRRSLTRE